MAKMGETSVIDIVAKMVGAHSGKNGWSSLLQKWVELTVAKIRGGLEYHPCMLSFF